ncbi:unnamed protein product, partial [marine sediment metagenome]
MPFNVEDPQMEVLNRIRSIMNRAPTYLIDQQERGEREQAAEAYSGENEKHFTDYLRDFITTSRKATTDIRRTQSILYRPPLDILAYQET